MIYRKIILILICVIFSISCTSKKDRRTEKYIESSLISKISEYQKNNNIYATYTYDEMKSSIVNDSISFYVLNYDITDMYGIKRKSFVYGYFNMNTGYDVTDEDGYNDDSDDSYDSYDRFMNTQIF